MRFKSKSNKFQVFAITGVNTISFGIKASEQAKKGLLGFAVERVDPAANERYTMPAVAWLLCSAALGPDLRSSAP